VAQGKVEHSLSGFSELGALVETLRGDNGCPWDQQQTPQSMITQLIEEAYELLDAISAEDPEAVCEELGDVLFHIFFLARLYEEKKDFNIQAVTSRITTKMIRRHPHVFGDSIIHTAEEVKAQWHKIKKEEKKEKASRSILDSVSASLPSLMRAYRLSERAGRAGFDWENLEGVFEKVEEEWREFKAAMLDNQSGRSNKEAVELEFGDLLFTLTNVARFLQIHPESALTMANMKFQKRFCELEKTIEETGREFSSVSQDEKDRIWEQVKKRNAL
jgi:tetrapyrrole methylase family protein/MazG family protein